MEKHMKRHRFNIFPEMDKDDYGRLRDDLSLHGYDSSQPIYVFEGCILDGWNRQKACIELSIEPAYQEFTGSDEAALLFVMRTNHRRNLTSSQWACIAVEAEELREVLSKEAKERQIQGGREKVQQTIVEAPIDRQTSSKLASAFNTNRTYIDAAAKVKESHPEKFQEVMRGEKALSQVSREVKQETLKAKTPEAPSGKYRVIYADPPWKYNDALAISQDGLGESYGPADAHYPQMTISELCALPIKDIAEDDAVLFLWTTSPLLEDTFSIIKAWGFKYKTSFIWDKIKHNMGHYNSVRHEFLLICTRGSCTPDEKKLFDSVQSIERTDRHSEKPKEFREIIETLYTYGEKIELFARVEHEGWRAWGHEANN